MKVSITKVYTFEACHSLPEYVGPCHNLHGHSYKLEVTVSGTVRGDGPFKGMLMDLKDLKLFITTYFGHLDHSNLNDSYENPTAENMAVDIFQQLSKHIEETYDNVVVDKVKLWETETGCAEVSR